MLHKIENFLTEQIRPALESHGGNVELVDVNNNKVYLRLMGGCQGCAGARYTMKNGIERMIKMHFPEIEEVIDVTDHGMSEDPETT